MELRHLRHFVAVAEELHFARAAERLRMEQSPLSHSIRNLEAELGINLFQRTTKRTWLTRAGSRFYAEPLATQARQLLLAIGLVEEQEPRAPAVRKAEPVEIVEQSRPGRRGNPRTVSTRRCEAPSIGSRPPVSGSSANSASR